MDMADGANLTNGSPHHKCSAEHGICTTVNKQRLWFVVVMDFLNVFLSMLIGKETQKQFMPRIDGNVYSILYLPQQRTRETRSIQHYEEHYTSPLYQ